MFWYSIICSLKIIIKYIFFFYFLLGQSMNIDLCYVMEFSFQSERAYSFINWGKGHNILFNFFSNHESSSKLTSILFITAVVSGIFIFIYLPMSFPPYFLQCSDLYLSAKHLFSNFIHFTWFQHCHDIPCTSV